LAGIFYLDDPEKTPSTASRQIKREAFQTMKKPLKLQTNYPILDIN
jgi:hypothetical protein